MAIWTGAACPDTSQTISPNRLMGWASTASVLQMPAAMASSSAAKNDTPGKGPSARRPSDLLPVLLSKTPRKLNLTKLTKMVGRSSEDPQGQTLSSLQKTDIPLCVSPYSVQLTYCGISKTNAPVYFRGG